MLDKMKQLMEMQRQMQEMKRELENTVFEVASADGLIKITMSGTQEIKAVNIQGDIKDMDKASLEKAFKDVYNKANKRVQEVASHKMKDITGFNLPGLV